MKTNRLILLGLSALIFSACTLPFPTNKAGLIVTSNPQANVFLDNKSLGQTPYTQESLKQGTYNLKITANDTTLSPYEAKITLNPGIFTVVDRQLASDPTKAHGYILSFESLSNKSASEVNIVSFPDNASVMVDGAPMNFTPFKSDSIAPGPHAITLTAAGYEDLLIKASVKAGYRLVITAQLGAANVVPTPTPVATSSAVPNSTPTPKQPAVEITPLPKQASGAAVLKPYVEILETGKGWLRVRETASTDGVELAKVNTGDKFPYIATSGSWYQIEYQKGLKGYVSITYAKLTQ